MRKLFLFLFTLSCTNTVKPPEHDGFIIEEKECKDVIEKITTNSYICSHKEHELIIKTDRDMWALCKCRKRF